MLETLNTFFNPEKYRGMTVDIVHIGSLERTASGKKLVEIEDQKMSSQILNFIKQLQSAGISVRLINDLSKFIPPNNSETDKKIIVGGAHIGQCIDDYVKVIEQAGYIPQVDRLLSLKLGI